MSFHIFHINEVYSNADGTVQFIEFVGDDNFQDLWAGHSIISTNGVNTNTYNIATNLPSSATAGKSVLFATQGFANLGIVAPDFIIPSSFLFINGGTVNFPGMDSVSYSVLPTDGTHSLNRDGATGINSPTDFAGVTGTVPGAAGNQISGGAGDDTITGGLVNDTLNGDGGNDTLTGLAGNDTINGGTGVDTAVYSNARAGYTVTKTASGHTVSGPEGNDTLTNVERLSFADGTLGLDTSGTSGQMYRLYKAAFDRVPDAPGLGHNIRLVDAGLTLAQMSAAFAQSAEFTNTYGTLSNAQFINQLYLNVLDRMPDAPGLAHNLNLLNTTLTRADMLAAYSESPENQLNVIGQIQDGIWFT